MGAQVLLRFQMSLPTWPPRVQNEALDRARELAYRRTLELKNFQRTEEQRLSAVGREFGIDSVRYRNAYALSQETRAEILAADTEYNILRALCVGQSSTYCALGLRVVVQRERESLDVVARFVDRAAEGQRPNAETRGPTGGRRRLVGGSTRRQAAARERSRSQQRRAE